MNALSALPAWSPPSLPKVKPPPATTPDTLCARGCVKHPLSDEDRQRTYDTRWLNQQAVEYRFVDFANALEPRLQTMKMLRPTIMEKPFDTIYDDGRLKVVDTEMTIDERAWVEDQLNFDGSLPRLADAFNRQVARTYDEDNGSWDIQGNFHGSESLNADGFEVSDPVNASRFRRINYAGLGNTVNGSVKLMSLYKETANVKLPPYWDEASRYRLGGYLVQNYLQGDVSYYVRLADGSVELKVERGSYRQEDYVI